MQQSEKDLSYIMRRITSRRTSCIYKCCIKSRISYLAYAQLFLNRVLSKRGGSTVATCGCVWVSNLFLAVMSACLPHIFAICTGSIASTCNPPPSPCEGPEWDNFLWPPYFHLRQVLGIIFSLTTSLFVEAPAHVESGQG